MTKPPKTTTIINPTKSNQPTNQTISKTPPPPPLLLPPLSELISKPKHKKDFPSITGNISSLLDFSIAEFPKCGTTFLMNHLDKSDEIHIHQSEVCSLDRSWPYRIVERYYDIASRRKYAMNDTLRFIGLKCPRELETENALGEYGRYFPNVKWIVTMRHPVKFFESYYNFRAYRGYPEYQMPPTKHLIGPCQPNTPYIPLCNHHCQPNANMNVCTDRANFHHPLSRLGKTPMNTTEELTLLNHHNLSIHGTELNHSRVFLMEMTQLKVDHISSRTLMKDLSRFLDLNEGLPDLKPFHGSVSREEKYPDLDARSKTIDICDEEHDDVRKVLVENGKRASMWIRDYFLESDDVVVSSREEFVRLIELWEHDPCEDG